MSDEKTSAEQRAALQQARVILAEQQEAERLLTEILDEKPPRKLARHGQERANSHAKTNRQR